jgi:CRP-like cAMP-binding protein
MAEALELLRQVPVFAGLPDDQLAWFLSQSQEMHLTPGDIYARQEDPADAMFVLLEGEFQARGELAGETFVLQLKAGEVTGVLPFSRMKRSCERACHDGSSTSAISGFVFS